jgi:hypothetical protein
MKEVIVSNNTKDGNYGLVALCSNVLFSFSFIRIKKERVIVLKNEQGKKDTRLSLTSL